MRQTTVILAGGLATRLGSLTEKIPKSLIDIHGSPFIEYQLRLLKSFDLNRVVICCGHLGEMVQHCIGDGSRFGMQVQYSIDGPHLMGTAGAIKKALPLLGDSFYVLYGDSYLLCDYRTVEAAFQQSKKTALMTVFRNQGAWDKSNVEFFDGQIHRYDKAAPTPKMEYIDYGLGLFKSEAFDLVPVDTKYDLACLYQQLLEAKDLAGFEVKERFYEIGSIGGIEEIRLFLEDYRIQA